MRRKKGFTLIELLVVISIIALLLSILLPSLSKAKNMARKVICNTHLHNLGLTIESFRADNNGNSPGAWWGTNSFNRRIYFESLVMEGYIEGEETVSGNSEWVVSASSTRKAYSCPSFRRFIKSKNDILGAGWSSTASEQYPVGYGYNSHLSRYNIWNTATDKPEASSTWSYLGKTPNSNTLVLIDSSAFFLNNRVGGRFSPVYEMSTRYASFNGSIAGVHSGGYANSLWADMHAETRKADEYSNRNPSNPADYIGSSILDHKDLKHDDGGYQYSEPKGKIACVE